MLDLKAQGVKIPENWEEGLKLCFTKAFLSRDEKSMNLIMDELQKSNLETTWCLDVKNHYNYKKEMDRYIDRFIEEFHSSTGWIKQNDVLKKYCENVGEGAVEGVFNRLYERNELSVLFKLMDKEEFKFHLLKNKEGLKLKADEEMIMQFNNNLDDIYYLIALGANPHLAKEQKIMKDSYIDSLQQNYFKYFSEEDPQSNSHSFP
jgi:hypothetical protein